MYVHPQSIFFLLLLLLLLLFVALKISIHVITQLYINFYKETDKRQQKQISIKKKRKEYRMGDTKEKKRPQTLPSGDH